MDVPQSFDFEFNDTRRYLISSCQSNTAPNVPLMRNMIAYADKIGGEIMLGPVEYSSGNDGPCDSSFEFFRGFKKFLKHGPERLAPDLVVAFGIKILPTVANPLAGMESFPPDASSIVPHQRIAMISVPRYDDAPLFRYTTGSVTEHNARDSKAGSIAEFHHVAGFLIVEVQSDGNWWVRQVSAHDDGSFQDLNHYVSDEEVYSAEPVEAIVCGDTHVACLDGVVDGVLFGHTGMVSDLAPRHVLLHDIFDGESVSRYNRGDVLTKMQLQADDKMDLQKELDRLGFWLKATAEHYRNTKFHIVPSNHDDRLHQMFNKIDWRNETPKNALAYLTVARTVMAKIVNGEDFNLLQIALDSVFQAENVNWLNYGDSLMIEDVQCGLHGHIGANGGPASPNGFAKSGQKTFIGHSHSATIRGGCYQVGASCDLHQSYNKKGPSSWSHHSGVIYRGGKRTLVHIKNGQYRAK